MARALDRLEETIERVMKDTVTQHLGGRLHPVEIARKLTQAMDGNQKISAQRILVPNVYVVHLSPPDAEALEPFRATLQREFASYLAQTMEEAGLSSLTYPRVMLSEDPGAPRRRIRVEWRFEEGERTPDEETGQTVRLQLPAVVTQTRKAWLISTGPGGTEFTHNVRHLPFSIGRALDNDLVLDGQGVSRHHAQLRAMQRHLYIVDLSSTNGTLLNGRRVSENVLKDGDVISVGQMRLTFRQQT